jgi:hypothetical protein
MMSEVTNRFDSALEGVVTAANINTTFIVPAGCYFRGQISWYWVAGGANTSVGVSKSGVNVAVLSPVAALTAGMINSINVPVVLNEGTYTVASIQAGGSSTVSWSGICFRK